MTTTLATATPVQIDTHIAEILREIARYETQVERANHTLRSNYANDAQRDQARADEEAAVRAIAVRESELAQFETEFTARGGWTRYYLVNNSNGHVHSSTACSTCFPTTQYKWLVDQSGTTAADLVELAGERACTVCFPWAPVETLRRASRLRSDDEIAREQREAERAVKAAAKAAKAIVDPVDGGPLRINRDRRYPDTIATARAAQIALVDHMWYAKHWGDEDGKHAANIEILTVALAAKHGTTRDEEYAAAEVRLAAREKREARM